MKNRLPQLLIPALLLGTLHVSAQTRYKEPVFENVNIVQGVTFGANVDALRSNPSNPAVFGAQMQEVAGIITSGGDIPLKFFLSNAQLPPSDQTALKLFPLEMDIYTPAGDDVSNRPVIIYLHTGNFLPPVINGGVTGSRRDSAVVNSCKRWARAGYTAVAISYRLGWNPIAQGEGSADIRRGTLLQAVYRAIHDTQTAVRYLRSTLAGGNPYGINPEQIVLYGQGSGGYVAQAYNTLNDYDTEIAGLSKFINLTTFEPYVKEEVDGTIDGGPGFFRLPDPLQLAGIDRSISMSINAGGALADISWLDEGEAPMVSFHAIRDPFAPFGNGTVVVPTTEEDVVDVSGANIFIPQAVNFGNNDAFKDMPSEGDPYTTRARSLYGQTFDYILSAQPTITVAQNAEGLFPIVRPINTLSGNIFTNESGPWDWWDFATFEQVVAGTNAALGLTGADAYNANTIHGGSLAGNPGMGPEKGNAYLDTIQGYANPRIMCVLGLPGVECTTINTRNSVTESNTNVFPNPSREALNIRNTEQIIRRVELYDLTGRLVRSTVVNANEYRFERGAASNGVYMLQIVFDNERITKKILFN